MLLGKDLYRQLLKEARHLPDSRVRCAPISLLLITQPSPPLIPLPLAHPHSEHYLQSIRHSFRQPPPPESSAHALRRVKDAQKVRPSPPRPSLAGLQS